jgi:hypothetical protein
MIDEELKENLHYTSNLYTKRAEVIELDFNVYQMVTINGQSRLAVKKNGRWEMDHTCRDINEMLEAGLVCEESVLGWIDTRKRIPNARVND